MDTVDKILTAVAALAILSTCHGMTDDHEVVSINEDLGYINGQETLEIIEGFNNKNRWLSEIFMEEAQIIINNSELENTGDRGLLHFDGHDETKRFEFAMGNFQRIIDVYPFRGTSFTIDDDISIKIELLDDHERNQLAENLRARLIEEARLRYEAETGQPACFQERYSDAVRHILGEPCGPS